MVRKLATTLYTRCVYRYWRREYLNLPIQQPNVSMTIRIKCFRLARHNDLPEIQRRGIDTRKPRIGEDRGLGSGAVLLQIGLLRNVKWVGALWYGCGSSHKNRHFITQKERFVTKTGCFITNFHIAVLHRNGQNSYFLVTYLVNGVAYLPLAAWKPVFLTLESMALPHFSPSYLYGHKYGRSPQKTVVHHQKWVVHIDTKQRL